MGLYHTVGLVLDTCIIPGGEWQAEDTRFKMLSVLNLTFNGTHLWTDSTLRSPQHLEFDLHGWLQYEYYIPYPQGYLNPLIR